MNPGNDNPHAYVLGVDVGGTKIHIGKARRDCIPLEVKRFPTVSRNQDTTIDSIFQSIESYLSDSNSYPPLALGMGLVGHVNIAEGIWENAINVSITEPVPICSEIYRRFGIPAYIDNDVNMATLAEMVFGAGRAYTDFIYINVGTGISAGLVYNGTIIRGASNYAGEIGHTVCGGEEVKCKCGRDGCLEPLASGGGMIDMAKKAVQNVPQSSLAGHLKACSLTSETIFHEADRGDPAAMMIAEKARHALEDTVVNLVNLLNPSLIVFGGGAIQNDFIAHRLTKYVYQNALPVAARSLRELRVSSLEPSLVGLIGASCAAWNGLDEIM